MRQAQKQREKRLPHRHYAYLGPDLAMAELCNRQFIYVDPQDENLSAHLIARGYWEAWIDIAVRLMLKPGDRVIEAGSNLGYYTLLMAAQIGKRGRLDTFEANPRISDLLAQSVQFNGFAGTVRTHNKALSNTSGLIPFVFRRSDSGMGHMGTSTVAGDSGLHSRQIESVKLDDLFPDDTVDFLRMDAEGAEGLIIDGAWDLIERSPNLKICTEWDVAMMSARCDVAALVSRLESAGFRFWLIERNSTFTPTPVNRVAALPHCDLVISRQHPLHGA